MALYHKWDVKNDFAYVLQFFSLISDSLGSVALHEMPDWLNFLLNIAAFLQINAISMGDFFL